MKYRILGKTNFRVSEISLGTWQLGARWGEPFDDRLAEATLEKALEVGINFIDTADVYSSGLSEKAVGSFVRKYRDKLHFATKCGRRLNPHTAEGYNEQNLRRFVEDSLRNMGLDRLDLVQLHCPPTSVYYSPEVFEVLDRLTAEGKIAYYGVSVEKVEEALKAIEYENVATVQIIFNIFRQRPAELFFGEAYKRNVGIIVRVPLASGLLSGKYSPYTSFNEGDHRYFNRQGQVFDRGETFAGLDYEQGLLAVEALKKIFGADKSLAQYALKWILMFEEVSCVIPGASRPEQVSENAAASELSDLNIETMNQIKAIYHEFIKKYVHHYW